MPAINNDCCKVAIMIELLFAKISLAILIVKCSVESWICKTSALLHLAYIYHADKAVVRQIKRCAGALKKSPAGLHLAQSSIKYAKYILFIEEQPFSKLECSKFDAMVQRDGFTSDEKRFLQECYVKLENLDCYRQKVQLSTSTKRQIYKMILKWESFNRKEDKNIFYRIANVEKGILLKKDKIRKLQESIINFIFSKFFRIRIKTGDRKILAKYGNSIWLCDSFLAAAGIRERKYLSDDARKRLHVIYRPFIKTLKLQTQFLESKKKSTFRNIRMAKARKKLLHAIPDNEAVIESIPFLYPREIDIATTKNEKELVRMKHLSTSKLISAKKEQIALEIYGAVMKLIINLVSDENKALYLDKHLLKLKKHHIY